MNCLDYSDSDEESQVPLEPHVQAGPAVAAPKAAVKRFLDKDDNEGPSRGASVQPIK